MLQAPNPRQNLKQRKDNKRDSMNSKRRPAPATPELEGIKCKTEMNGTRAYRFFRSASRVERLARLWGIIMLYTIKPECP
jgi:hypothetical protein